MSTLAPLGNPGPAQSRSIRIPDDVWEACKTRAGARNIHMSEVVNRFLRGYAEGALALPEVHIRMDYTTPTK